MPAPLLQLFAAVLLLVSSRAQDTLFHHARVWSGDPANASADAVLVVGDRVRFVGAAEEARRRAPAGCVEVDCGGNTLLPGITDAHVHFLWGGDELLAPDLRSARSEEEFAQRLGEAARGAAKGSWLTSGTWDHEAWPGGALPTRRLLDRFVPDHPVFVSRLDGHMAVANSLALRIAGVTAKTADVPGGEIVRGDDGEPTGVLKDAAMALVSSRVPAWNAEQRLQRARAALRHAAELGVTSAHDMLDSWEPLQTYQDLRDAGELTCRLVAYAPAAQIERLVAARIRRGFGDDWLAVHGVKGFADGSLGSTTAWFDEPYADAPDTSGLPMPGLVDGDLAEVLRQCAHAGLQPAIHAIGDRANATVLDLMAASDGLRSQRPRIEHAQHLRAADIARFAEQGVIASMQPYHCADDGRWAEKRIGADRCRTTYAFKSLLDAGANVAFGSDWPVAPLSPWLGLDAAVTRRTIDGKQPDGFVPEQKLTLEQALTAYTRGGAFAAHREGRLGVLRPGMLADLIVLDRDLFASDELGQVQVRLTMVGGRVVHRRGL
ncbi:MAG: amidohydrolase [Planctomycetes bacterium]|nr:amidohydrolase [Planctomycetota bacterium]